MPKRVIGLSAFKDKVVFIDGEIPDDTDEPFIVLSDGTWKIQSGDRAAAYQVLHQQCADYIREAGIEEAIVKASAVMSKGSARLGMLHTAEVRGVLIAAAASVCRVVQVQKGTVSRTYGERKVDEYIEADDFWEEHTVGEPLRKGSREVAMLVIASRNA